MRHFAGTRAEQPQVVFKSDAGPDLLKAANSVGWIINPACPRRRVHNAKCENKINQVKRSARACLLESGLPLNSWPDCVQCVSDARTFTIESDCTPGKTRYEVLNDAPFHGQLIPFGALVFYRFYDAKKEGHPFGAWTKPGLFAGYELKYGVEFTGAYKVYDLETLRNKRDKGLQIITIKEVALPITPNGKPRIVFPFGEARGLAIEEGKDSTFKAVKVDKHDSTAHQKLVETPAPAPEELTKSLKSVSRSLGPLHAAMHAMA